MTVDQVLERISKVSGALGEIIKVVLMIGLIWIAYVVLVHPERVKQALAGLQGSGINVEKWEASLPFFKVSGTVFTAAEAVASAQAKVAAAQNAPGAPAELRAVSASLAQAQSAVAQHAREVRAAATRAGIVDTPPATGWLYVGFVANSGFKKLSDRIDPKDAGALKLEGGKPTGLTQVTLTLDAAVAQGEECVRVSLDSVANAAAVEALLPQVMLEHDTARPLAVLRLQACPSAAGQFVWAEVKVPADRILALARR